MHNKIYGQLQEVMSHQGYWTQFYPYNVEWLLEIHLITQDYNSTYLSAEIARWVASASETASIIPHINSSAYWSVLGTIDIWKNIYDILKYFSIFRLPIKCILNQLHEAWSLQASRAKH